MKVLSVTIYEEIVGFINKYVGLPIDCERALVNRFKDIDEMTLAAILSSECRDKTKSVYYRMVRRISKMVEKYGVDGYATGDKTLLNVAIETGLPPTNLSRLILHEKYKHCHKAEILRMLRNPHLVPDAQLAANIRMCTMNDNQEGPIVDVIRRCIGEEYEIKLKAYATNVGMVYCDERDLRRIGFDKTPDLKLALPCLYKGSVFNWIESKALFGDCRSHKKYLREQLESYTNRFGAGIVIYWLGYVEDILHMEDNCDGLIIMSTFPDKADLEFLKL